MLLLRDIILFILIAVGLGSGSAYFAVNHADRLAVFQVGAWKSWPGASAPNANPYTKADQARRGSLPTGTSEGVAFVAVTDNDGTPLDGNCQYRLVGHHMPARLWTVSLITDKGLLVDNPSSRYSFHSRNVARENGDKFEIMTGPDVMGGNWLRSEADSSFQLVLRLYETPLTSSGGLADVALPELSWVSCE